ncbi:BlaI/MecI/CopY family transcriptional regulator [Marinicella sediminis]|uniref:BlaI/MecI/CopY family transcriptional regulator n=1 Tax=Marinicella sediminis TaxID=1792834 RepID=A0ABV7J9A1_9GAMM|nr:BlaI/MecI/CopY family transcriptional regulator [Marinicella sediminis]
MEHTISQAELVIMKMLWAQSPLSAVQINEQIRDQNWRMATVKTLINRLLKKGFISYEQQGRTYYYQPVIEKSAYLEAQNESFLNDLYDGRLSDMLAAFTQQERLSSKEIEELKNIIDDMEHSS